MAFHIEYSKKRGCRTRKVQVQVRYLHTSWYYIHHVHIQMFIFIGYSFMPHVRRFSWWSRHIHLEDMLGKPCFRALLKLRSGRTSQRVSFFFGGGMFFFGRGKNTAPRVVTYNDVCFLFLCEMMVLISLWSVFVDVNFAGITVQLFWFAWQ